MRTVMAGGGRRAPCLPEGGETLIQCVTVHHGDGPVHDVRHARPLALQDGREFARRLAVPLPDHGADDLAVSADGILPADLARLRRLSGHDGLAARAPAKLLLLCPDCGEPGVKAS